MSPIPRCDLRLPTDRKKSARLDTNALKVVSKQKSVRKARSQDEPMSASVAAVQEQNEPPTTEKPEMPPASEMPGSEAPPPVEKTQAPTTPPNETPVGCLPHKADAAAEEEDTKEKCDPVPEGRVRAGPDDAESLEIKREIKTGEIPRDTADSIEKSAKMKKLAFGEGINPVCTRGEEEGLVEKQEWVPCAGAPGDTTYDWIVYERPESPEAVMPPPTIDFEDLANLTPTQIEERMCKKRKTKFKYVKMWGSEEAIRRWTRHKLEARRLRKQLEKKHAQNAWLREKMRVHARMKRRMYRCKDQSKIPSLNEDIQINKAFYFRFNYNNQVPCMPADMNKHFSKFKKPPFRSTGSNAHCVRAVDEFEKLRVQNRQSS